MKPTEARIRRRVLLPGACFVLAAMPGCAPGAGGLPGIQAGAAERVQATGRAAAGSGQVAYQDRRQQNTQNL